MVSDREHLRNKYQNGEWPNVIDPATGKPTVRNIFYSSRISLHQLSGPIDPDDENSIYSRLEHAGIAIERGSVSDLPHRGFWSFATSCRSHRGGVKDGLAHAEPGIFVVAGMSAALALLQAQGHNTKVSAYDSMACG
jgi:hypothetical protein